MIEHHYIPSVGVTVQTAIGSKEAMKGDWFAAYRAKYCIDADFLAAAERARQESKIEFGGPFSEQPLSSLVLFD